MYRCNYCRRSIFLDGIPKAKTVRNGCLCKECRDKEIEVIFVCLPDDKNNGFYDLKENILTIIDSMEIDELLAIKKTEMTAEKFYTLPEFDGF